MNLIHSIHCFLFLIVSSLAVNSGQSELEASETSVIPQRIAFRAQGYGQTQPRELRRPNQNQDNSPNSTSIRSTVSRANQSIDTSPPYAGSDYRTVQSSNGLMGQTVTIQSNPSLRSNVYANNGYHFGFGQYYGGNQYNGGNLYNELATLLTIASFKDNKCDGSDKNDYLIQLVFSRNKLCTRYAIYGEEYCSTNTIAFKVSGKREVDQFTILFFAIEDKGGQKTITIFGYIIEGSLSGYYILLTINYELFMVHHKCDRVMGVSHIQSDATELKLLELTPQTVSECYKMPTLCRDKTLSSIKTKCQGTALTT